MVKLFANNGDPDQTPHSTASGNAVLVCTVCQLPVYGSPVFNGLIEIVSVPYTKCSYYQTIKFHEVKFL